MKVIVHVCPECDEEFNTEKELVDHLNEAHQYDWTQEHYHQICGNMNQRTRGD